MARFNRFILALFVGSVLIGGTIVSSATASATSYTSSLDFTIATAGDNVAVENYSGGTAGQLIADGSSFDTLTYNFISRPGGNTLNGGIITNQLNDFSGLSLGGNQSTGDQFFYGGDSVTVTFAAPVTAVGIFFNVNPQSGNYDLNTPAGDVSTSPGTGSTPVYDTNTFVFDGIVSTTPFSTFTVVSDDISLGSYNIPEIEYVTATPIPATLPLLAAGLGVMGLLGWGRRRKTTAVTA